ncbi:hypothetical protein FH972_023403 [Carpinus fangiana]|uniref:Phosphatidate phosphatase APP1 catalytic domain-containing protein n=1 Tax=Carpinus fangiana TaxID=176857 RepID=A0A5N6KV40_9ROSI|nr:hypothetical protein FH972_023403 [Carpinus fangiana]
MCAALKRGEGGQPVPPGPWCVVPLGLGPLCHPSPAGTAEAKAWTTGKPPAGKPHSNLSQVSTAVYPCFALFSALARAPTPPTIDCHTAPKNAPATATASTMAALSLSLAAAIAICVQASPAPTAFVAAVAVPAPAVTPSVVQRVPTRTFKDRRDIISDIRSGADSLGGDLSSILGGLGTDIPSYVASGVPNFFQDFPTGDAVQSSLGIDDAQVSALPTQVLNIPPYANWTEQGWNVRFHGNVYKQPNTSEADLNRLANVFLPDVDITSLPADQATQARNLTAEIFVLQQDNERPVFSLAPAPSQGADGSSGGAGGVISATGGRQEIQVPYNTTLEGDYDVFLPIQSNGITAGNATTQIQRLAVYTQGTDSGNATAYLVPPGPGLTIVSDIDDILRVTKIYQPKEGLLNSFARPFTPWMNMPDVYRNWSQHLSLPEATHFHYLTTTPEQVTRNYMQFIYANYPGGSFDTRPLNFSDVPATLSIRAALLQKVFETFPQRKFILVADTSNADVMRDYPMMATTYPDQVQCIFLRNTSATDPDDKFPYDTSGFKGINQNKYMFFVTPDDLMDLDIASGQCYNGSVPQNVTFGVQGLPFGINLGSGGGGSGTSSAAGPSGTGGGSGAAVGSQAQASFVALVGALAAAWNLL